MDEFHQLKKEIEDLILHDYLGKYIHGASLIPMLQTRGTFDLARDQQPID